MLVALSVIKETTKRNENLGNPYFHPPIKQIKYTFNLKMLKNKFTQDFVTIISGNKVYKNQHEKRNLVSPNEIRMKATKIISIKNKFAIKRKL
jgi:hypothetical protein